MFNRRLQMAIENIDDRCRLHEERKAAAIADAAIAAAKAHEVANGEGASETVPADVAATEGDLHADSGDSVDSQSTEYDSGTAH